MASIVFGQFLALIVGTSSGDVCVDSQLRSSRMARIASRRVTAAGATLRLVRALWRRKKKLGAY